MNAEIKQFLSQELFGDDDEVRSQFISHFNSEIEAFVDSMVSAHESWLKYDKTVGTDKRRAYVAAFLFNALNNLLASMKLFVSGYSIPSGNLVRQTLEAIFTAILCSCKKLQVYQQIDRNKFSTKDSGKLVLKHSELLNIKKKSIKDAMKIYAFYHKFSHSTLLALAHNISFTTSGTIYVGPSFDAEKLFAYRKEVSGRLNIAKTISNVIEGILMEQERTS
jgi:hypothetical protein